GGARQGGRGEGGWRGGGAAARRRARRSLARGTWRVGASRRAQDHLLADRGEAEKGGALMAADWTKGFESTRPEDANAPNRDRDQKWSGPGTMAEAVKERWKGIPKP